MCALIFVFVLSQPHKRETVKLYSETVNAAKIVLPSAGSKMTLKEATAE